MTSLNKVKVINRAQFNNFLENGLNGYDSKTKEILYHFLSTIVCVINGNQEICDNKKCEIGLKCNKICNGYTDKVEKIIDIINNDIENNIKLSIQVEGNPLKNAIDEIYNELIKND